MEIHVKIISLSYSLFKLHCYKLEEQFMEMCDVMIELLVCGCYISINRTYMCICFLKYKNLLNTHRDPQKSRLYVDVDNTIYLIPVTLSKPGTTSATFPSLSGALIDVIIPPYVIISTVTLLVFFNVYLKKFTIIPNVYIYDNDR